MKSCRAMRNMSLGGVGRAGSLLRGGRLLDAPRRGYCLMRLARGLYDGFAGVMELGEVISGRRSLSFASRQGVMDAGKREIRPSKRFNSPPLTTSRHSSSSTTPTTDSSPPPALPEQLRSTMRLLAHSVVVCTSAHNHSPRGMTMSSFTSLTLTPTPLITFNVATPSRTLDAIKSSQHFNIHVLEGTAKGAAVADHFTRGNASDHVFDGLEGVTCQIGEGAPVVMGEGVLRVLRCKVVGDAPEGGLVRVGDHVVVVGEVLEVVRGEGEGFGLAYTDRKYREVGGVIPKNK